MKTNFKVVFLEEAIEFLDNLDLKARQKIYYNIDKAKLGLDPKLFKKLTDDIWEFRTKYKGQQFRLLAFWDKNDKANTLVVTTHGIIKKVGKLPLADINKASNIRQEYFNKNKE